MQAPRASQVTAVAAALAAVAGYVDALGYLLLRGVFTSHATGDTAHIGNALASGDLAQAMRFAWPLFMFVAGLFVSAAITAIAKKRGFHSSFGISLGIEALLLLISPLITGYLALAAVLAGSMGIQTLTVTTARGLRIYTTYMTGNLSKFAEGATKYLISGSRIERDHSIITGLLWIFFVAGALAGAAAHGIWGRMAAVAPAVPIALLAAADFKRPIDPADELQG
jgi:uncharacterized membrane protein YoaK (UPF0700 family)